MHKDIVFDFPSDAEQLAATAICENQGMYAKGRYITVQGHPEFTREIVEEVVKGRYAQGVFTDEMYKDAMRRIVDHDDGIIVAQAFLRFLLED
jgi:GMP synthase-like glutamine amidotransferase